MPTSAGSSPYLAYRVLSDQLVLEGLRDRLAQRVQRVLQDRKAQRVQGEGAMARQGRLALLALLADLDPEVLRVLQDLLDRHPLPTTYGEWCATSFLEWERS